MIAHADMLISQDTPTYESSTEELTLVAVLLVAAASKARDGDREALANGRDEPP